MTLEQIFFRFCKEEGVYDDVFRWIKDKQEHLNSIVNDKNDLVKTPNKILSTCFNTYGVRNIFPHLVGYHWSMVSFYKKNPHFKNVCKKWRYFVDNNIIIDERILKENDNVSLRFLAKDINFKVKILTPFQIRPSDDSPFKHYIFSIFKIKTINGKPSKLSWLVKKNKKIYGLTQRD